MKNYKKLYIGLAAILIAFAAAALYYTAGQTEEAQYIAVSDGEKIFLDEYLVYLVIQQRAFEETGGGDIWDTNFDGEPAIETAKQNALDSIIYVKSAVSLSKEDNLESPYTPEELNERINNYYQGLTENQKQTIGFEAVSNVMTENTMLSNYADQEGIARIEAIVQSKTVEKNPAVWDSVVYLE